MAMVDDYKSLPLTEINNYGSTVLNYQTNFMVERRRPSSERLAVFGVYLIRGRPLL